MRARMAVVPLFVLLLALPLLPACDDEGCEEGHDIKLGDVCHRSTGIDDPLENCAECHGAGLRGGKGPSCYECHDTDGHTIDRDGKMHWDSTASRCVTCHGPGNSGGMGPACTTCHGSSR